MTVQADRAGPHHVTANVTLTSDYRFRGVSYSSKEPALQGGLSFAGDRGWFAGIWGSTALGGAGASEIDLYAGLTGQIQGIDYSLAAYVYMDGAASNIQYAEFQALLTRGIGPMSLQLEASAAPKPRRGIASNLYLAVTAAMPIPHSRLTITLHAGRENGFFDHKADWEAGLSYRLSKVTFAAALIGSAQPSRPERAAVGRGGTRLVLSATAAF
jgi:uncharacterized protein (TIGR02001 family)